MFPRSSDSAASSSNFLHNFLRLPSDALVSGISTMSTTDCSAGGSDSCHDKVAATNLRIAAICVIFTGSTLGILIPLVGRRSRFLSVDRNPFFVLKAFAAGVILATAFVHMLPDTNDKLNNPCLPEHPWGVFPWAGFIPMLGSLATLLSDFAATEFYMSRNPGVDEVSNSAAKNDDPENNHAGRSHMCMAGSHVHDHDHGDEESAFSKARYIVVAQVFEFGIIAHSVIIGISLGVSSSPCFIRPLFAALVFHQFFEGCALGGCIAQAGFLNRAAAIMGFFFAVTTPLGIGIGMGIATAYNENSPTALIVQGVFNGISAGILIYMSLVELIAVDFLSKRMRSSRKLQFFAFAALFLGAGAMSLIGYWA